MYVCVRWCGSSKHASPPPLSPSPRQPNLTNTPHPTDLWSTACVRCPEALTKLDGMAAQYASEAAAGKVMFATVNIDDKAKGAGIVEEK